MIALALPAGYIAIKIGGLRALVGALIIYGLGFLGTGMLSQYHWLVALFLFSGVGFGAFHPISFALIAKWTPKERRGRAMGNFTATGDIGRVGLTAALSFIVVAIGWQHTAMLYATAALLLAVGLGWRFLRKRDSVQVEESRPEAVSLWRVFKNKRFLLAACTEAMDTFSSGVLYLFLPFLLLARGADPALLGAFTAAYFIGNMSGKILIGRLVDKFGNVKTFVVSELIMAGLILVLANSHLVWLVVACSVVLGVFAKGTLPAVQTMISDSVEHHGNFEKAFGLTALITGVAVTVAPLLLGFISDHLSIFSAFNVMAGFALLAIVPAIGYHLSKPKGAQS
jgi:MFS family permease